MATLNQSTPGRKSWLARTNKSTRIAIAMVASVLIFIGWAFLREARKILAQPVSSWTEDVNADCAVVLTGGPNRIREGVELLARRSVQKLIISGVNPQSGFRDIFAHWPFYRDIHEQDIILERRSRTTYGNAQQSLPLVEALRCRDVVVITSRSHMRRAMNTFRAEFPSGYPLIPRAVVSGSVQPGWGELATETVKSLFYSSWVY